MGFPYTYIKAQVYTIQLHGPFGLKPLGYLNLETLRGPRTQNNRVSGPKYYNINGIWALTPYYLGPWTLRARLTTENTMLPWVPLACRNRAVNPPKVGQKALRSRKRYMGGVKNMVPFLVSHHMSYGLNSLKGGYIGDYYRVY